MERAVPWQPEDRTGGGGGLSGQGPRFGLFGLVGPFGRARDPPTVCGPEGTAQRAPGIAFPVARPLELLEVLGVLGVLRGTRVVVRGLRGYLGC